MLPLSMFKKWAIYFFLLVDIYQLNSCISPAIIAEGEEIQYTNQEKAELSAKSYLKRAYDSVGVYTPYGFGPVEEIIPDQVIQLKEFKEMRKLLPGMKDNYGDKLDSIMITYDSLIARKEREIKDKKIKSFWKISHIYTVKLKSDSVLACEFELTFDPNFKMYDVHSKMAAKLDKDMGSWFHHYYMQFPLFSSFDEEDDRERSKNIYNFFDEKLMASTENKEWVLEQILFITKHIQVNGIFSNQKIIEAEIKKELQTKLGPTYKPQKFSELKAIIEKTESGDNVILGYTMNHLYQVAETDQLVTQALYFEFDSWLILAGYLPIESPYEQYFEK